MLGKLTLKELQSQCIGLGIKTYGTKATLIKRIKETKANNDDEARENAILNLRLDESDTVSDIATATTETEDDEDDFLITIPVINEEARGPTKSVVNSNDDDDECEEDSDSDEDGVYNTENKKRKRTESIYSFATKFDSIAEANDHLKHEKLENDCTWKFIRSRPTKDGKKDCYKCSNSICKKRCYVLYSEEDETVAIWINNLEHEHKIENSKKWGINAVTKREIEKLYVNGITFASRIQYALRKMMDPNDITYVEGVEEPLRWQINNFINNSVKVKSIKPNFSFADLVEWVKCHKAIPDDEHEPFIIDDFIQVNDKVPKASIIRISISTKYLIGLCRKRKHICADATYKLIWQGKNILYFFSLIG